MSLELVPKPSKKLKEALGEDVAEELVDYIEKSQSFGKKTMNELSTERYERRLMEETGKLRAEMHDGFSKIQEQFREVYKEFARIHEKIASLHEAIQTQTRWMIAAIFGAIPLYLALYKYL
ncbi:hypothetical protein EHQ81_01775 [Leptospira selangorensis]|uniref:DUF1640 domain-containing protein n=1 Tax=Leptospira selangorensis TaxID=2484982 RepID=A0A4R9G0N2_9LEPT|nr:hypothetical protein [Leptospira selangorensis]TGK04535.1 hypothetical protein EHO58_11595 [Leptospira selangorensis]TGM11992.1 hypothetical protein EHQ82_20840 [Leptospira selangorensis]TGM15147.1 hypothetical protein EHQ81_01775 [Leptospira selangorensis]